MSERLRREIEAIFAAQREKEDRSGAERERKAAAERQAAREREERLAIFATRIRTLIDALVASANHALMANDHEIRPDIRDSGQPDLRYVVSRRAGGGERAITIALSEAGEVSFAVSVTDSTWNLVVERFPIDAVDADAAVTALTTCIRHIVEGTQTIQQWTFRR